MDEGGHRPGRWVLHCAARGRRSGGASDPVPPVGWLRRLRESGERRGPADSAGALKQGAPAGEMRGVQID